MGVIQTETPYFQPSVNTPFSPTYYNDPTFCTDDYRCNMAYALNMNNCQNIFVYGTGFYSFFNTWSQKCLQPPYGPNCQKNIVSITGSTNIFLYALNTYGSEFMLTSDQPFSNAKDNLNTFCSTAIMVYIN